MMTYARQGIVQAAINGIDVSFVVDSGATNSVISPGAADRHKLPYRADARGKMIGAGGRFDVYRTGVKRFTLGDTDFNDVDFMVGGRISSRGTAVGFLGQDFLGKADIEYDLANGVVRLHTPNDECKKERLAYWAKERPVVEVGLTSVTRPYLQKITSVAYVNDVKVSVLFDTGAATSALTLKTARQMGITPESKGVVPGPTTHGGDGREIPTWIGPVKSFALGDEKISDTHLVFGGLELTATYPVDMLLGADFFLSHRIYVARGQEKIYITYNGGPVFGVDDKVVGPMTSDSADPATADGFARRAAASVARRDLKRALSDLERACEMAPSESRYFLQRARARFALAQQAMALADVNEAIRLDPNNVDALLFRVRLHTAKGNVAGVREDVAAAASAASGTPYLRRDIARYYVALGQSAEAVDQLDQWISANGKETDLHEALHERCRARALSGSELDKALADCDSAIKVVRKSEYLDSRGLVYLRMNRLPRSIEDYDAALSVSPKLAWSLYGRGIARLRSGAVEAGNADIAAAREIRKSIDDEAGRYGLKP